MTPELKTACEVIFQEHKTSTQPIKWSRDSFRGQLSIGLSELAKETLVKKNIIILPNKSKKILTQLNPAVATASSFEEAEVMIVSKAQIPVPVVAITGTTNTTAYPNSEFSEPGLTYSGYSQPALLIAGEATMHATATKWYMKPLFYYVIWPVCAVVAGAILTFLINQAFMEIFWHPK